MYRHLAEVLATASGEKVSQPVKVRHPDGRVVEYTSVDDVPVFNASDDKTHLVARAPRLQRRRNQ